MIPVSADLRYTGPRASADSSAFTPKLRTAMSVPPRAATRGACMSRYA